jgi:hypothetical protein
LRANNMTLPGSSDRIRHCDVRGSGRTRVRAPGEPKTPNRQGINNFGASTDTASKRHCDVNQVDQPR